MKDGPLTKIKQWAGPEIGHPTLQSWLTTLYPKAKEQARAIIKEKCERGDDEYLLSGRFNDVDRNVLRTLHNIEAVYDKDSTRFFRNVFNGDMRQMTKLFLPLACYELLVKEIVDAASAEWYYTYEKKWD